MKKLLLLTIFFMLLSCASPSVPSIISPIEKDLIGTWIAEQNERFNVYEFLDDGTGIMKTNSAEIREFRFVPFTYEFVSEYTIRFSAEEGHSILIDLAMPTSNQLIYDAQVEGRYHIDFNKVDPCERVTLFNCIVGRWELVTYQNELYYFTIFDFYLNGSGAGFVPDIADTLHFSFEEIDENSIRYTKEDEPPITIKVSQPDAYKMIFEYPDGERWIFYRIENNFFQEEK